MAGPILQIDLSAQTPAYQQIVDGLRVLMLSGALPPDSRLPSVRDLATDLAVHHNTVAEAYRILAADGWLDLRQGRSAVVLRRARVSANHDDEAWLAGRARELAVQAMARGLDAGQIVDVMKDAVKSVTMRETK